MGATTLETQHQVTFPLWGGEAEVTTSASAMPAARAAVEQTIAIVDAACSSFRSDSDLSRVNSGAGSWVLTSDTFVEILQRTLDLVRTCGGRLDPTVGSVTLRPQAPVTRRRSSVRDIEVSGLSVRIPTGTALDLNATAKAWCADQAAQGAAQLSGTGVLVGLCGDIGTSGPSPSQGWEVVCGDDHRHVDEGHAHAIVIRDGGVATSSLAVRATATGTHIVDPLSMRRLTGPWRTVTVAAASCLQANAAATAALAMGDAAVRWLESLRLPARLVHNDGTVITTEGWPS